MIQVQVIKPEALARKFHETYERLAPQFGYSTRDDSRVPWEMVPEANKGLMVAVAQEILTWIRSEDFWPLVEKPKAKGG